jgi:hypothetical protein
MSDDDWAQRQLYQMGIPTDKALKECSAEVSGNLGIGGKLSEKDLPINSRKTIPKPLHRFLCRLETKAGKGRMNRRGILDALEI